MGSLMGNKLISLYDADVLALIRHLEFLLPRLTFGGFVLIQAVPLAKRAALSSRRAEAMSIHGGAQERSCENLKTLFLNAASGKSPCTSIELWRAMADDAWCQAQFILRARRSV